MKRHVRSFAAVLAASALVLGSAGAQTHVQNTRSSAPAAQTPAGPQQQTPHGAPELSPGLAGAGILLLVGGMLVLLARRRPARA
jgi:hypothetical protein